MFSEFSLQKIRRLRASLSKCCPLKSVVLDVRFYIWLLSNNHSMVKILYYLFVKLIHYFTIHPY